MNVALNISGSILKILALKGKKVKKWASAGLPAGSVRDGLILQPKAVGEAINSLFKSTGLPREGAAVSIAGLSFTYRFITLPRMRQSLEEEAVTRAARKEISVSLDELYLSWQRIPGAGSEQTYFIVGVPRNLIDSAVETLKIAGVASYVMDLCPLALARTADRRNAIIVNMEPDNFDIVFVTGGVPAIIHTASPRSEGATLEDNIRRVADEVTKTAAFYQGSHPETQFNNATSLLLTGELAAEPAAGALLQAEIPYPVESLIPPVDYPDKLPLQTYAATIGLALKGVPVKTFSRNGHVAAYDINVNVLAGKYRKPKAKPIAAGYVWLGVFLAAAVALLFPLNLTRTHTSAEVSTLQSNLDNLKHEINLATLANEDATAQETTITNTNSAAAAVQAAAASILGTRGDYTNALKLTTAALPSYTTITSVEVRAGNIVVRGQTDSVFTAIAYAMALENENSFSGVRITSLNEGGGDGLPAGAVTFEILITR